MRSRGFAQTPQPRAMWRHALDRLTHRSERPQRPRINTERHRLAAAQPAADVCPVIDRARSQHLGIARHEGAPDCPLYRPAALGRSARPFAQVRKSTQWLMNGERLGRQGPTASDAVWMEPGEMCKNILDRTPTDKPPSPQSMTGSKGCGPAATTIWPSPIRFLNCWRDLKYWHVRARVLRKRSIASPTLNSIGLRVV